MLDVMRSARSAFVEALQSSLAPFTSFASFSCTHFFTPVFRIPSLPVLVYPVALRGFRAVVRVLAEVLPLVGHFWIDDCPCVARCACCASCSRLGFDLGSAISGSAIAVLSPRQP